MANDVIINVKVNNKADFSSVKASLIDLGNAADKAFSTLAGSAASAAANATQLAGTLAGTAGAAGGMASSLGEAGSQVGAFASSLGGVVLMAGAALGIFAALAPALLAAGGAAGAAIAGIAGLGIALSTLAIGFGGIGAALTAHSKAAAGAGAASKKSAEDQYQAAKRIKDAEETLADAKAREKDAAKDVTKAIADEIDRRRELDLQVRGAAIGQKEAATALAEAKEKARRADIAGSDFEKQEADNALQRAQLNFDEQKEKLGDLTQEKKKAVKDGVMGSDQVQAALKKEADAHKATLKAQENLTDAHHKTAVAAAGAAGGIDAFSAAMAKLSPNAQKLVYALLDIEKRFDAIKKRVQDRLLAGFDVAVTDLANKWLPHLDDILGGMADHLNAFGKGLMKALGDPTLIGNVQKMGDTFGKFIDKLAPGINGFIDALGRIGAAASPVLLLIGDRIGKILTKFDEWIKSADKSGKLQSFFDTAANVLGKIWDIGEKVVGIVGQFIAIIFDDSLSAGTSVLDNVMKALDGISAWLKDPKTKTEIKYLAGIMKDAVEWLAKHLPTIVGAIKNIVTQVYIYIQAAIIMKNKIMDGIHAIGSGWDWLKGKASAFWSWLKNSASSVGSALSGMWHGMQTGFKNVVNNIIGWWNHLSFTIGGGSWMGMSFPSVTIDTPNIPYLARGGIAGGLAMVGERGRELVRLPQGSTVIPNGQTEGMMAGMGGSAHVTLGFASDTGNALMGAIIDGMRRYVQTRGGNVQTALGRVGAVH